jgi:phytoene dehydrogenase-like protein
VHPLAAASPFFRGIDLQALGVTVRTPKVTFAHPLDGGRAAAVAGSVDETVGGLWPRRARLPAAVRSAGA